MPNPWLIIGVLVALLASAGGGFLGGNHYAGLTYKAAIAKQDAQASTLLAQLTATALAKDQASSEHARDLDTQHTKDIADAQDRANAAADDYTLRLRKLASRPRCPSPGTTQAANPGVGENTSSGSNDQLAIESGRTLAELGKAADTLAAYARACHEFAVGVGR